MREQRDCDCAELTCIGEGDTCCEGERGSGALYLTATFVKALSLTGALLCPLQAPYFVPSTGALPRVLISSLVIVLIDPPYQPMLYGTQVLYYVLEISHVSCPVVTLCSPMYMLRS